MSDILLTALLLYTRRRPFVQNGLQIYIAELTWRIHSQSRGLPTLRLYGQLELEHLAQARKKIGGLQAYSLWISGASFWGSSR